MVGRDGRGLPPRLNQPLKDDGMKRIRDGQAGRDKPRPTQTFVTDL